MSWRGRGADARAPLTTSGRTMRGAQLHLALSVDQALQAGVAVFEQAGFVAHTTQPEPGLRDSGSAWTASALHIGGVESWSKDILRSITELTPLGLLPRFRHQLSPTLVVIAVRSTQPGSEVTIFAHPTTKLTLTGSSENINAELVPVAEAITSLREHVQQAGALRKFTPLKRIPNDGNPASQAEVRAKLGWK